VRAGGAEPIRANDRPKPADARDLQVSPDRAERGNGARHRRETGTGKELVAEIIHQNSAHRTGPLVKVACCLPTRVPSRKRAVRPREGRFTSAGRPAEGTVRAIAQGTIFLDEVGEMTLATQKKLLRVLQGKGIRASWRLHADQSRHSSNAATNRDLAEEVAHGNFPRRPLLRLNVITLETPPLRRALG